MKKFLSLVLALVMTMSLVVVSASATEFENFGDVKSIEHPEAVEVLNKIGVITGYEDGSFHPEKTLTREQAAKIICIMALGTDAASKLGVEKAPFPDVPATSQFAGYIGYCVSTGIINGYNDGTFKPKNTLTGYAFSKMLLGVLGYGVKDEYVGNNWALNVARDGVKTGVFDKATVTADPIDRDNAAQVAFNALTANLVAWSDLFGTYTAYTYNLGKQELLGTLAYNVFNLTPTGVKVDKFGYNTTAWKQGVKIISNYYVRDTILGTETNSDLTGNQIYNAYSWDDNGVEIIFNNTDRTTAFAQANGNATVNKGRVDAKDLLKVKNASAKLIQKGYTVNFVDTAYSYNGTAVDKDGLVDKIIISAPYLAEVTSVKAATASNNRSVNLTVYAAKSGAKAAFTVTGVETEEFAKGDMILITPDGDTSGGFSDPAKMEVAKSFDGAVTAYYLNGAAKNDGSVTVDGVKYGYNWIFANGDNIAMGDDLAQNGYTLNKGLYTFYLDDCGNVIGAKVKEDAINDYAYIIAKGEDAFQQHNIAKVLTSDGKIATYTVASTSDNAARDLDGKAGNDSSAAVKGTIWAYSINTDGQIVLTALTAPYSQEAYTDRTGVVGGDKVTGFTKGSTLLTYQTANGKSAVAYVNDATVFAYLNIEKGTVTLYTGKDNAPSISNGKPKTASVVVNSRTGSPYATFVVLTDAAEATMTTNYVYVLNSAVIGYSKDVNGNPVYYYSVLKDGVKTVIASSNTQPTTDGVGVYAYALDEKAFVSDEPNSVESGEYTMEKAKSDVTTSVKVGVITNNTVFATVDPDAALNQYVITPDTVIADISNSSNIVAKDATLATGDTVTVVYAKTGDLYVAKTIYITAHAAEGTLGDTTAPAVNAQVDKSANINGTAAATAQTLNPVGNNDNKNTVTGAVSGEVFTVTATKAANTRITVYVSGAGKAVSTTVFDDDSTDCVAAYTLVDGDYSGIVTVVVTAQAEGHRPVSTTYKLAINAKA